MQSFLNSERPPGVILDKLPLDSFLIKTTSSESSDARTKFSDLQSLFDREARNNAFSELNSDEQIDFVITGTGSDSGARLSVSGNGFEDLGTDENYAGEEGKAFLTVFDLKSFFAQGKDQSDRVPDRAASGDSSSASLVVPLTQLLTRFIGRWKIPRWFSGPDAPPSGPAKSATSPATKPLPQVPPQTLPTQSSINHTHRIGRRVAATSALTGGQTSNSARPSELTRYMLQVATDPAVASELFDSSRAEDSAGLEVFAGIALLSNVMTKDRQRRRKDRRSQNTIVGFTKHGSS